MIRKIAVRLLIIFTISYLISNFIYYNYEKEIKEKNKVYLIKDELNSDSEILQVDGIYNYIGMTTDIKNANKIKDIYSTHGKKITINESEIENNDFYNELLQYDILLKNTDDYEQIKKILETILATYQETATLSDEY